MEKGPNQDEVLFSKLLGEWQPTLEKYGGKDIDSQINFLRRFESYLSNTLGDIQEQLPSGTTQWRKAKEGDPIARDLITNPITQEPSDS